MEGNSETQTPPQIPEAKGPDAQKFLKTFTERAQQTEPEWINRIKERGSEAVIFTLGSGASNIETDAFKALFPQARKFAVDTDRIGDALAQYFGFSFIHDSAANPEIYLRDREELRPDLVIIRNLKPEKNNPTWVNALRLAWEKLNNGGILYLTASKNEPEIITNLLAQATGLDHEELKKYWERNPHRLSKSSFPDDFTFSLFYYKNPNNPDCFTNLI